MGGWIENRGLRIDIHKASAATAGKRPIVGAAYFSMERKTPAAKMVPMTPAMFGPMANIRR